MYLSSVSLATLLVTTSSFTVGPLFVPTSSRSRSSSQQTLRLSSSRSDQGWNNDNFLDALGGGNDAIEDANSQYYRESENRAAFLDQRLEAMGRSRPGVGSGDDDETTALFGAQVPGMPDKVPKAPEHDEDNPMGGELFRKMMEKAKQKQEMGGGLGVGSGGTTGGGFVNQPQPQSIPSVPTAPPVAAPVAPAAAAPPAQPSQLSQADQMAIYLQQVQVWQQQMTAYAQFSATNPEAAAQMTMPPAPTPPNFNGPAATITAAAPVAETPPAPTSYAAPPQPQQPPVPVTTDPKDYLPKGSGNKDAYEITNPADVYLAQLKRDSYVRTEARKRGDIETANKPFADYGIKAIGSILSDELLQTRREHIARNGGEFETSRDEMIIPYAEEEDTRNNADTGISYRQKLMEVKQKRQGLAEQ